jgi:hypothetical protein
VKARYPQQITDAQTGTWGCTYSTAAALHAEYAVAMVHCGCSDCCRGLKLTHRAACKCYVILLSGVKLHPQLVPNFSACKARWCCIGPAASAAAATRLRLSSMTGRYRCTPFPAICHGPPLDNLYCVP